MTPNFALNLSEDGIDLLHRDPGGSAWVRVETVALDDPDLSGALHALRKRAVELEGEAFSTKLILPASQLLYAEIATGKHPKRDVKRALEERTPYKIDEINYAVSGSGDSRKVVAVAKETLTEAEAFLAPYDLNPVGFTAIPRRGHFKGEPNLGAFGGSEGFSPDAKPVKIAERYVAPEPAAKAAVKPVDLSSKNPEDAVPKDPPLPAQPEPRKPAASLKEGFASQRSSDSAVSGATGTRINRLSARIASPEKAAEIAAKAKPAATRNRRLTHLIAGTEQAPGTEIAPPEPAKPVVQKPVMAAPLKSVRVERPKSAPSLPPKQPGLVGPAAALAARRPEPKSPGPTQRIEKTDPLAKLAAQEAAMQRGRPLLAPAMVVGVGLALLAALAVFLMPERGPSGLFGAQPSTAELDSVESAPVSVNESEFAAVPGGPGQIASQDAPSIASVEEIAIPRQTAAAPDPAAPATKAPEISSATNYETTGIWDRSPALSEASAVPDAPEAIDQFYVASIDPGVNFEDPAALRIDPQASLGTTPAPGQDLPVPGQRFAFDARGLVIATPEGALTPTGVLAYSEPEIAPQQRPVTASLVDDADQILSEDESGQDVAAEPSELVFVTPDLDPRVADIRPQPRPATLGDAVERAVLGGRTRDELARFVPQRRPERVEEAVREAAAEAAETEPSDTAQIDAIALAVAQAEAEGAAEAAADAPTERAVARSTIPAARPSQVQLATARTQTPAPARSAAEQSAAASTAALARPRSPTVVRSARVAPTAPTTRTAARAATQDNALSLNRMALVGVFGAANNRRALIRMPSGRFEKVTVGDRIDGGRIAAIGESQLQYVKGTRTITLKMP